MESLQNKETERELYEGNLESVKQLVGALSKRMLQTKSDLVETLNKHEAEIVKVRKFSIERLALDLLAVTDSLEHVLKDRSNINNIKKAVELTLKQLKAACTRHRIIAVPTKNERFNPEIHQAVSTTFSDVDEGLIVTELQKGYTIWERLLRPALVIVSKGPNPIGDDEVNEQDSWN